MKIAIPIWEEKVSPLLDTASRLLIVELENQTPSSSFETYMEETDISRKCSRIHGLGVDILICGAISRPFITMLSGLGIDIIPWISGNWKDVLEAYLDGNLFRPDFLRPGFKKNKICRKN